MKSTTIKHKAGLREIMECNFQKVLLENELMQGCDGYNLIIELSVCLQTISLSLWCSNMNIYTEIYDPPSICRHHW